MNVVELTLTGIAHLGEAIGKHNGKIVFVPYAIPGETVKARIIKDEGDYFRAELVEVITPSFFREIPQCKIFGICGGCSFQHIAYSYQTKLKEIVLMEQLKRIGGFENPEDFTEITIKADNPYNYRNRADFSINTQKLLGFKIRGSHKFINVEYCHIMHDSINRILSIIQRKSPKRKTHNITIRYGINTGQLLVQPEINTEEIETGQKFYFEKILDREFMISAPSFFQVNTYQAQKLIEVVLSYINPADRIIIDAYAGVGTFTVFLAERAERVIAIEESRSAFKDAQVNIKKFDNISYLCKKTEEALFEPNINGNVIVIDPPRVGCMKEVLEAIAQKQIKKVIYVSCEPSTLARDLKYLKEKGYRLVEVQPVDMFPQTYHIENVALMQLDK
ncbi:MAG TPA: class I SAM-dependent RNA methyltransferase [Thermodesulfovibrio thiophilus]|uniref:class I SAM-dependent RNA methyltransferase n=1 Tax=Thermodesulfovibrio thiophilus TaxID=340095 RepID=UPI00183CC383|nr:class I SAM-dependent RNA methyltransferase [Thermodesulfovibrio thiophilus]HHW19986.1 class I SAM-dependent RNA methyltransferase [Thermodesulfovibrio thiophilus]HOA83264.1 class I SAM-dependent RNA methyltransferase [Thermodesulfovibrio thiophilus]HQD36533.1 class I SAM-dependent RNA methyltransferase [Thermodesulfovibrio thiophilus]